MTAFTARCARYELLADVDVDVLGVSEHPDGGGRQLIFERARSFSEQDRALGMETFAVSSKSAATVYGAVTSYDVDEAELVLDLTPSGASELGLSPRTRIGLELDPDEARQLVAGLRRVVDGTQEP